MKLIFFFVFYTTYVARALRRIHRFENLFFVRDFFFFSFSLFFPAPRRRGFVTVGVNAAQSRRRTVGNTTGGDHLSIVFRLLSSPSEEEEPSSSSPTYPHATIASQRGDIPLLLLLLLLPSTVIPHRFNFQQPKPIRFSSARARRSRVVFVLLLLLYSFVFPSSRVLFPRPTVRKSRVFCSASTSSRDPSRPCIIR